MKKNPKKKNPKKKPQNLNDAKKSKNLNDEEPELVKDLNKKVSGLYLSKDPKKGKNHTGTEDTEENIEEEKAPKSKFSGSDSGDKKTSIKGKLETDSEEDIPKPKMPLKKKTVSKKEIPENPPEKPDEKPEKKIIKT